MAFRSEEFYKTLPAYEILNVINEIVFNAGTKNGEILSDITIAKFGATYQVLMYFWKEDEQVPVNENLDN